MDDEVLDLSPDTVEAEKDEILDTTPSEAAIEALETAATVQAIDNLVSESMDVKIYATLQQLIDRVETLEDTITGIVQGECSQIREMFHVEHAQVNNPVHEVLDKGTDFAADSADQTVKTVKKWI